MQRTTENAVNKQVMMIDSDPQPPVAAAQAKQQSRASHSASRAAAASAAVENAGELIVTDKLESNGGVQT